MADGVTFQAVTLATPPDATVVATDDCGGSGQAQIMKLAIATNGSATLIPADANGLLVNLGANNDVTVTGTVTATGPLTDTELRASAVPVSMAAVPTGGATAANQATEIASLASIDGKITAVNTGAVVVASGSITANAGTNLNTSALATEATLSTLNGKVTAVDTGAVVIASGTTAVTNAGTFAVQAAQSGTWTVQPGNTANTTAWKVDGSAVTQPVSGTFWQATQPVSLAATVTTKETRSSTGTSANVASSASNVTLLASNANRLGATLYNDSTQTCYVKMGATATSSSFSYLMVAASTLEIPFNYTGIIDGIWASANGNMRVTEFT